jgi:hypothetical protein
MNRPTDTADDLPVLRIPLELQRVLIQRLQQFLRCLKKESTKLGAAFVGVLAH